MFRDILWSRLFLRFSFTGECSEEVWSFDFRNIVDVFCGYKSELLSSLNP